MNSQQAPLPVRKRPLQGERPARIKLFFAFKTPDSKASAKSPNEFCVLRALIQRRQERTKRRYPLPQERISDQEAVGGACSKMRAARNGDSTHCGLRAGIFERCNAVVGAIISGAAAL